jgi:hypothetical protein
VSKVYYLGWFSQFLSAPLSEGSVELNPYRSYQRDLMPHRVLQGDVKADTAKDLSASCE